MNSNEKILAKKFVEEINNLAKKIDHVRLMEVCGTHTVAIFRAGIRQLLPKNIELVSGPGCPVCVTSDDYIDKAIAYSKLDDVIITTFGDMLKVPGSNSSLTEAKADGAEVEIIYSPLDSIEIAKKNSSKKIIFLAVGFETTAPTAAATVLAAKNQGVKNLFMLSSQKLVPPALKMLLNDDEVNVNGFILPGHVAVVIGSNAFKFLANDYKIPGVVTGFEPLEILRSILQLLKMITENRSEILNEYQSVVTDEGNQSAQKILNQVYEPVNANWRGIGEIDRSGLKMRDEFADFDIEKILPLKVETLTKKTACRCGEVLRGVINPTSCPLFGKNCQPIHAIGPCMVSVEGVCAAWFKYGGGRLINL
ncbi:MAG: hydrogenase formation protein HypD [Selenomonadaceae bacterium]|nr:hydrogenase formation protein HypD [Selenomonadaceae bacterium]